MPVMLFFLRRQRSLPLLQRDPRLWKHRVSFATGSNPGFPSFPRRERRPVLAAGACLVLLFPTQIFLPFLASDRETACQPIASTSRDEPRPLLSARCKHFSLPLERAQRPPFFPFMGGLFFAAIGGFFPFAGLGGSVSFSSTCRFLLAAAGRPFVAGGRLLGLDPVCKKLLCAGLTLVVCAVFARWKSFFSALAAAPFFLLPLPHQRRLARRVSALFWTLRCCPRSERIALFFSRRSYSSFFPFPLCAGSGLKRASVNVLLFFRFGDSPFPAGWMINSFFSVFSQASDNDRRLAWGALSSFFFLVGGGFFSPGRGRRFFPSFPSSRRLGVRRAVSAVSRNLPWDSTEPFLCGAERRRETPPRRRWRGCRIAQRSLAPLSFAAIELSVGVRAADWRRLFARSTSLFSPGTYSSGAFSFAERRVCASAENLDFFKERLLLEVPLPSTRSRPLLFSGCL